ncbi:saccharopine dehydrogenase [Streptomyces sp. H10-C2]|uniref:saccharopine dehydrogenase n=1 Tax=unclassified Streptomyces TaxID=2593676 RepID=UPI0024BB6390|nr:MULTISPECIES: saccharopine dehydrogenase [unclassified Streptomyces]MDJ0344125.1 saccharopine dehydrogenase [Streptomyces sp. PH10-H1]MDJ0374881.1 saccharopine dehydrogenase [Streptomyces sp. H10-C2]
MSDMPRLWMRQESRPRERRAPIVPEDAARLVESGVRLTVEESPQRVFPLADYVEAGCEVGAAGSWTEAPDGHYIVGLKELPEKPSDLRHRHIYFGHAYKGQTGARALLDRFTAGGGALLDLEYLTDDDGRRLAAFGYWAGYVGAALAVLSRRGRLDTPLVPLGKSELDAALRASRAPAVTAPAVTAASVTAPSGTDGQPLSALVIGALGRCGRGACDALETAGLTPTRWDVDETENLDREALLAHDILVNTVLTTQPIPPFLTPSDLDDPRRRLSTICDVTCDVTSQCNVLPIYDDVTDWGHPVRRLRGGDRPVDVIAIDNLPSLLPGEASRAFSAELLPQLLNLVSQGDTAPAWARCLRTFEAAARAGSEENDHAR